MDPYTLNLCRTIMAPLKEPLMVPLKEPYLGTRTLRGFQPWQPLWAKAEQLAFRPRVSLVLESF